MDDNTFKVIVATGVVVLAIMAVVPYLPELKKQWQISMQRAEFEAREREARRKRELDSFCAMQMGPPEKRMQLPDDHPCRIR